jgi:ribosomal protein S18 acetylase RimI-like enzyme
MMENNSTLTFRKGEERDIPFLVDTVVAAEKSGTDMFSYSNIFEMPEEEVRKYLSLIMKEDIPGQELCYSVYLIAEVDGKTAGAVGAWVEGESGQQTSVRKAMLLNYFFPQENVSKAREKRKFLDQMHFDCDDGALVQDIGLVLPGYRGQGIYQKLMLEQIRLHRERVPALHVSQLHFLKSNQMAFNIYSRLGYKLTREKTCTDKVILNWLPSDTQLFMEKNI